MLANLNSYLKNKFETCMEGVFIERATERAALKEN